MKAFSQSLMKFRLSTVDGNYWTRDFSGDTLYFVQDQISATLQPITDLADAIEEALDNCV